MESPLNEVRGSAIDERHMVWRGFVEQFRLAGQPENQMDCTANEYPSFDSFNQKGVGIADCAD